MILTYELIDDPGNERQEQVETQFHACLWLQSNESFCLWWELSDSDGEVLMASA